MSNIVAFSKANLPALTTALRKMETVVGPSGVVIIKMDKTGHWVFGADQTEVEQGSRWAVNPFSFVHGYIAWGDGEVLGEKMVTIQEPLPELEAAPPQAKKGWETQVGCALKCVSGEDAGMEARFTTTSVGGKRAVQELAVAIAEAVDKDPSRPIPVVELGKEHYQHKSYGRIFTPVFGIADWLSPDHDAAPDAQAAPEPETPAPSRRRRAAA